jgi:hypothetical protein
LFDINIIRRLLHPSKINSGSIEENAENLRIHLVAVQEQVIAAANKTKKAKERARHIESCKHAVLVFFRYLSRGAASEPCTYDECAAVADKAFRFSCPLLPSQVFFKHLSDESFLPLALLNAPHFFLNLFFV